MIAIEASSASTSARAARTATSPGCTSSGLARGVTIDFGTNDCPTDDSVEAPHLVRWTKATAGLRTSCPDGKPGCADRELEGDDAKARKMTPLPEVSEVGKRALRRLGEAITSRRDFWEAEVDRELRRFLGWWQSGFKRPDFDLPAVRSALADRLAKTGSVRDLEEEIVSSYLYIAMACSGQAQARRRSPWSAGPLKAPTAEHWLDSAGVAVGETLGRCDYRFVDASGPELFHTDPALLSPVSPTLGTDVWPSSDDESAYDDLAVRLGGCSASPRPAGPSVALVETEREAARRLCSIASGVVEGDLTDATDAVLAGEVSRFYARALGRTPTQRETRFLVGGMRGCLQRGAAVAANEEGARQAGARALNRRRVGCARASSNLRSSERIERHAMTTTRRKLLQSAFAGVALSAIPPIARAETTHPARAKRVLVLHLSGGIRSSAAFHASRKKALNPWGIIERTGDLALGKLLDDQLGGGAPSGDADYTLSDAWDGLRLPRFRETAKRFAVVGTWEPERGDHVPSELQGSTGALSGNAPGVLLRVRMGMASADDAVPPFEVSPMSSLGHAPNGTLSPYTPVVIYDPDRVRLRRCSETATVR